MNDRGFATAVAPVGDTDEAKAKKREEELQLEIEEIKKEYADRKAKKLIKAKDKDKSKENDDTKKEDKEMDDKVDHLIPENSRSEL